MADVDYDDDELFADLYEDDAAAASTAKPTAPSVAPVPESAPEPVIAQEQVETKQEEPDNGGYDNGNGNYDNRDGYQNDGDGGNDSYMQDEGNQSGPGPVGIKEDGKMFIGGLNWETTDESLKAYFTQFGKVVECTVMRDGATGRSRGFGFLTFDDPKTVNTVMVKEHYLDGKIIDPKRAIPREEQERTAKIFVGGVHHDATEEIFRNFFSQFGRVIDATLMMDKDTGHPRGFGFVTFEGDGAVEQALSRPLAILNKPIEVKRAEPRGGVHDDSGRGGFGGRGGRGGKFANIGNRGDNDGGQGGGQMGMGGQGGQGDMSGSTMAKYWFAMQQYFANMQQNLAMQMQGGGRGMGMNSMMGGGQMNPQMMQQMQAMMAGRGQGGMQMNPQMMQQMMMQQQMMNQQGGGGGPGGMGMGGGGGGPGGGNFDAAQQNNFEQNKYEKQGQGGNQRFNQGTAQAWDGMYDDVAPPSAPPSGPRGGGSTGPIRNQGGRGGRQQQGSTPPAGPSAPAGAPTGPRNAGNAGGNFRGGRGGGNQRGGRGGGNRFNPY